MKTRLLISALMLAGAMAYAQDKTPVAPEKNTPDATADKSKRITPTIDVTPSRAEGKRVVYGGVLVDLARTDRPIRSLNPLGNSESASVTNNLSVDPVSHKPDGIRFFTISFKKW